MHGWMDTWSLYMVFIHSALVHDGQMGHGDGWGAVGWGEKRTE